MKIYVGFAYTENEYEKVKANKLANEELRKKYRVLKTTQEPLEADLENYDIVYSRISGSQYRANYKVYKKPDNISEREILCIISNGAMPFGGGHCGNDYYSIYLD